MKKKIIFSSILLATVITLVIAMVLAVSACSSSETAPTNAQIENSSENTVNNTSLESSFDNSSESKISEKSNIESSINSNVSSDSQNSKAENSKKETQNSNSSSKPNETSKSSNTSTNSSSNSKVPSNDSSSKPSSGSSSSTPSHSHSYSSKTVKATCTSGGYTVHTCSCGASYTDSYTDATGHRWSDWKTVKKATTSSEGRKQRTCSSCGKTESKTIAKVQGSSTSGGHKITGARKAVYSYRGMDSFSSVNLVDLINAERAKEGLGKLEWTADVLTRLVKEDPDVAEIYSDYFDSNGNFNPYIDPEVREPLEGAQKMADMGYATHGNGVGCSCVGSTLHEGDTIEQALRRHIQGYMNSPEHRAILMNAGSHSVTAAYAIGSDGTVYTAIRVGG